MTIDSSASYHSGTESDSRDDYNLFFLTKKEKWFSFLIVCVLLIGWGPGTMLVNKPEFIFGIPLLWFWCVCWFVVWCLCVYLLIFKSGAKEFDE